MTRAERVMARWAMVTAFGTLVSAFAICFQWHEMHTGGRDTTRMADAAQQQACAANRFADSAESINDGVADAVKKLNLQAEALARNAKKMAALATTTENASRNALEADRPWLGPQMSVTNFDLGSVPQVRTFFENGGRRPGHLREFNSSFLFSEEFPSAPPYKTHPSHEISTAIVLPGGKVGKVYALLKVPLSERFLNGLNSLPEKLFVYSKVVYEDVKTGEVHHTYACIQYVPPTEDGAAFWSSCSTYNTAD